MNSCPAPQRLAETQFFMAMRFIVAILFIGTLLKAGAAHGAEPGGPLPLPIQHPLWALHGSLPPDTAAVSESGESSGRLITAWTTTFDRKARAFRFDEERVAVDAALAYGLTDGIEAGVHLALITRGGGILDSFIENWHDFFHLPNGGRDRFDQDQYEITGSYHDGSEVSLGSSGTGISNPDLWFKFGLTEDLQPLGLDALKIDFSFPGATNSFGHEGIDLGAQLLGCGVLPGELLGRLNWHWGGGYMFLGDDRIEQVRFRDNLLSGFLGAVLPANEKLDLQATLLLSSTPLKNIKQYPDYALYLDLGLKYHLSNGTVLELLIREDPIGRAAADISFVAGITSNF